MEHSEEFIPQAEQLTIEYPPKFQKPDQSSNIWIKSITSLGFYLIAGYYIFHSFEMLLLITGIVLIHEMGHFLAMKAFRYKDLGIFFIPLLGAYVSGSKREVSQRESAIILLAGPLPGIILGTIFYFLYKQDPTLQLGSIYLDKIALSFILLNMINLLPIYPLDGGQLLNRVYLEEESWIGKGFVFLSVGLLAWFSWKLYSYHQQPIYFLFLIFPIMMLLRLFGDSKLESVEKKIEEAHINMDRSYEDLTDEDYWKIRTILVQEHPMFKEIQPGPPYVYDGKEERVMTLIQSLLHRHLLQDVSMAGKLFIIIIWGAALASPWLLNMDLYFFRQFGF
jgi:stage IV sporulation protein FB